MSMCSKYVRTKYKDEMEEFRRNLEQWAETKYAQAMDKYNKRGALDGTPEAYAQAWEESENFLPIFVDAIAKKFGMSVSLLLVGPLGSEQGKIEMRSVHSNNAGSMTSLIWPQYDKVSFTNMQASLIRYGETVFSPEECKRHIPTSNDTGSEVTTSPPLVNATLPVSASPSSTTDLDTQASTTANEKPMNLVHPGNVFPFPTFPINFESVNSMLPPAEGKFTSMLSQDWNGHTQFWGTGNNQQSPWNDSLFPSGSTTGIMTPNFIRIPAMPVATTRPQINNPTNTVSSSTPPFLATPAAAVSASQVPAASSILTSTNSALPAVPALPLPVAQLLPATTVLPTALATIPAVLATSPNPASTNPAASAVLAFQTAMTLSTTSATIPAVPSASATSPNPTSINPTVGAATSPNPTSINPAVGAATSSNLALTNPAAPAVPALPSSMLPTITMDPAFQTTMTVSNPAALSNLVLTDPAAGAVTLSNLVLPDPATLPISDGTPMVQSNGKKNELPSKKWAHKASHKTHGQMSPPKKHTRNEVARDEGQPQRTSKLPPHLEDGEYVLPSKGTWKRAASKKK